MSEEILAGLDTIRNGYLSRNPSLKKIFDNLAEEVGTRTVEVIFDMGIVAGSMAALNALQTGSIEK